VEEVDNAAVERRRNIPAFLFQKDCFFLIVVEGATVVVVVFNDGSASAAEVKVVVIS
jgi:hypothetical protein